MNFKKNFTRIVVLFVVLILSIALFAACDDKKNPSGNDTTYSVTVQEGDGFEVSGISADGYHKDAEVDFTVTVTDSTKELKGVQVDGSTLLANANGHYGFRMPDHDVTISVVLESVPPTLELDKTEVSLNVHSDTSTVVTATLTPQTEGLTIVWTTSNFNVATVSGNGASATITAQSKGQATITASVAWQNETISAAVTVTVDDAITWSPEEEAIMKEHLHGLVLPTTSVEGMHVAWHSDLGLVIAEGGYVEASDLEEYLSKFSAEDGWHDLSDEYNITQGHYMFEKAVQTAEGTRYVRVELYAEDEFEYAGSEGFLYISGQDPYEYEWPAEYFSQLTQSLCSTQPIPAIQADRYYLESISALAVAYYESTEEDGGYGALLEAAGWTIEDLGDIYHTLSPDKMFSLGFYYSNGKLFISLGYPMLNEWPAEVIEKYFEHYSEQGAEVFDIPAYDGASSYIFVDNTYFNNSFAQDESKYNELYGTVKALDSTRVLYSTYLEKLASAGWEETDYGSDFYMKEVDQNKICVIRVRYVENADNGENIDCDTTEIDIYYVKRDIPAKGWQAQAIVDLIKKVIGEGVTDTVPVYDGTIVGFSIVSDCIYVEVPKEDLANAVNAYAQTLTAAGYQYDGHFSYAYISPNFQFALSLSKTSTTSAYPNSLCIYVKESLLNWNDEKIAEGLKAIGSSLTSLPDFAEGRDAICTYTIEDNTFKISFRSTQFNNGTDPVKVAWDAAWKKYQEVIKSMEGWTIDQTKTHDDVVVVTASDGTTITLTREYESIEEDGSYYYFGDYWIVITVPAE